MTQEPKDRLEQMRLKLLELKRICDYEGKIWTDDEEIEIFRKPPPPKGKSRWKWLWGHVLRGTHGIRIDYYLVTPTKDILLCVRGGGHRGYLKVNADWILAEITRLTALGDLIFELSRNNRASTKK